jgi:hypothetical protein
MRSNAARIVVAGYVVRGSVVGMAWHHVQYVHGLARLSRGVSFVEDSKDYSAAGARSSPSLPVPGACLLSPRGCYRTLLERVVAGVPEEHL